MPGALFRQRTLMIWLFEGVERSNGEIGRGRDEIQSGISKLLLLFIGMKNFTEKLVHIELSKEGNDKALFLEML